ncbi:alpha/beta hydrolase [Danxiaibacter flavus]|uniref:Alpha/beta hydrolase n=1 Tax=Danxiaibacter flavus TaxID=3049108 RepID=A0ABV3ZF20_9BACT|nr:alpha/beta hydrolase [Chitinophagaceae bacterium DXS]
MEKYFQYGAASFHYITEGKGKNVVLLHGFAEDAHIWDKQIAFLKEHCKVIAIDLPGSGESGMLEGDNIGIEDYADSVYAILQHEKADNCILLGHSLGGYITLAFAEKYPEVLSGFGLVHSTAFADSEEKKNVRKKGIEMIGQYGSYPFVKNTTPNLFSNKYKAEHPDDVKTLGESGNNFAPEALQQYYAAMMNRPDRTHVLSGSKTPVLFILGRDDVAAPIQDVLQQVHLPKRSHIHILENTGHMGMWEATDLVNSYLLDFIAGI